MYNKMCKDIIKQIKQGQIWSFYDDIETNKGYLVCNFENINVDNLELMKINSNGIFKYVSETSNKIVKYNTSILSLKEIVSFIDEHQNLDMFSEFPKNIDVKFVNHHGIYSQNLYDSVMNFNTLSGFDNKYFMSEITSEFLDSLKLAEYSLFCEQNKLTFIKLSDLILYLKRFDNVIELDSEVFLPTKYGEFKLFSFVSKYDSEYHLAIVKGDITNKDKVICRVHSECFTGDVLGSKKCDCGEQLSKALKLISKKGEGIIIYMRQEGRGIGLLNKLRAYKLQEQGLDTVEANVKLGFAPDLRDYFFAKDILNYFNVKSINLLTNNMDKVQKLTDYGVKISDVVEIEVDSNEYNKKYLLTKKELMNHNLKKV